MRAPASSANLGPGFDCLGLALDHYLTVDVEAASQLLIQVSGADTTGIPADETNFIWRTAAEVAETQGMPLPAANLRIENNIPLGKGMGSSAAALLCGIAIADVLLGLQWTREQIFAEAARREGHPDNVAASMFGGLAVSSWRENAAPCHIRIQPPVRLATALVVPDFPLPTREARSVLPAHYSRADAVHNIQRAALLVACLAAGDLSHMRTALADKVHQPYRSQLVPGLDAILHLQSPGLLGCCLSGAGPSVLVFAENDAMGAANLVRQEFLRHGVASEIVKAGIDTEGFLCERLTT